MSERDRVFAELLAAWAEARRDYAGEWITGARTQAEFDEGLAAEMAFWQARWTAAGGLVRGQDPLAAGRSVSADA